MNNKIIKMNKQTLIYVLLCVELFCLVSTFAVARKYSDKLNVDSDVGAVYGNDEQSDEDQFDATKPPRVRIPSPYPNCVYYSDGTVNCLGPIDYNNEIDGIKWGKK